MDASRSSSLPVPATERVVKFLRFEADISDLIMRDGMVQPHRSVMFEAGNAMAPPKERCLGSGILAEV